ncbi:MAG: hypothetical protein ACK2T7_02705, partial [Anaerolineales bacterium]
MKKFSKTIFSAVGAALGAAAAVWGLKKMQSRFEQDTETAIEKLITHSRVIETAAGEVEISIHG